MIVTVKQPRVVPGSGLTASTSTSTTPTILTLQMTHASALVDQIVRTQPMCDEWTFPSLLIWMSPLSF